MKQGQDMTFKYISKEHLIELIKMLPTDINIEINENSDIEILTEEQIAIEPKFIQTRFNCKNRQYCFND